MCFWLKERGNVCKEWVMFRRPYVPRRVVEKVRDVARGAAIRSMAGRAMARIEERVIDAI